MSPLFLSTVGLLRGGVVLVFRDKSCPLLALTTQPILMHKYFLFWPILKVLFKNPFLQLPLTDLFKFKPSPHPRWNSSLKSSLIPGPFPD